MDIVAVSFEFDSMADGMAEIPVRSERQAMDWCLVLASQGIEAAIEQVPESGLWRLRVQPEQLTAARTSIHLYLRENRNRRWQRTVPTTNLLFDWRCLFWALFLAIMYFLQSSLPLDIEAAGRMDANRVAQGEWYRLLTATTLHADAGHLAANLTLGLVLLGLAMGVHGAGTGLAATFFAGTFGNLTVLLLKGAPHFSLGASGAVMGALGLLAAHTCHKHPLQHYRRWLPPGLASGLMVLVLFGLNPGTDVLAHVGGFLGGFLASLFLSNKSVRRRSTAVWDAMLAWILAVTVSLAWCIAILRVIHQF